MMPLHDVLMKQLESKFIALRCHPHLVSCTLERERDRNTNVVVIHFAFMLESSLKSPRLMEVEKLVSDPARPRLFKASMNSATNLIELHIHLVCVNGRIRLCTQVRNLFCGMIIYVDGTTHCNLTRESLEPVMFSLSMFKRAMHKTF